MHVASLEAVFLFSSLGDSLRHTDTLTWRSCARRFRPDAVIRDAHMLFLHAFITWRRSQVHHLFHHNEHTRVLPAYRPAPDTTGQAAPLHWNWSDPSLWDPHLTAVAIHRPLFTAPSQADYAVHCPFTTIMM